MTESESMSDQSENAGPVGKISTGDQGLGTVTSEMVEERARELARMDGRTEPHGGDRERAREELVGTVDEGSGPEAGESAVENIVSWDEAPGDSGERAAQVLPEDDASIVETLVEEGMEEAEHDQRVAASEENPPEEV